jgi:hypothetical protein
MAWSRSWWAIMSRFQFLSSISICSSGSISTSPTASKYLCLTKTFQFIQYNDHTNTRRITSYTVCVPHINFTKFSFISKRHSTRWHLPPILEKCVSVSACPSDVVEPHPFGNDLIRQQVSSFRLVYSGKFGPTWWIISPSSISEGSSQCLDIQHFVVVIPSGKHNVNQLHTTWRAKCA